MGGSRWGPSIPRTFLPAPPAPSAPHLAAPAPAGHCNTRWGQCRPGRVTAPALALAPAPAVPTTSPCCWALGPSSSSTDWLQGETGSIRGMRVPMAPGREVSHDMPLRAWGQGLSPGHPHFGWIPGPLSCSVHGQWAAPKCAVAGRPGAAAPMGDDAPQAPCAMSQQSPRCQSCSFFVPQPRLCRKPD